MKLESKYQIERIASTSKHTQAPWHIGIRKHSSDKFIYGAKGEEIADCDRLTNFPEENLENARLIACAPELLEILIESYDAGCFSSLEMNEKVKQLISKAQGII